MKYIFFILCLWASEVSAQQLTLRGRVVDEKNKPISFAIIEVSTIQKSTFTDSLGNFSMSIPSKNAAQIYNLKVSNVGKKTIETAIPLAQLATPLVFRLYELSLSLNEVEITEVRKILNSNSSILFNRQAIEQAQAFSLADVLNNLPGKLYAPVNLQSPKNITLRTSVDANGALNNALGTAIIIDGLAQSNNANMQSKNVGTYGLGGSIISDYKNQVDYDVTFGGIDLRDIPVDNIESIEVISGVAPAQYGDLTDGAIILNRQAGKTSYQFNTRINGSSTNFSLGKGYKLGEKAGFLNVNLNYLISNNDPRDDLKKYDRISGGIIYTRYFGKNIKNTLSLDYSEKLDDAKSDPDDGRDLMTYSKNRRFGFADRISFDIKKSFLRRIQLNFGGDLGYQETYTQWYLNGNVKAMANKDTTGVYEGYYIPGNYTAIDQVVGKPKNFNANVSFLSDFNTGKIKHFISYGASIAISSNKGQGVLFDPEHPRFLNQGFKNERPYDFELIPTLVNTGFYAEDRFNLKVLDRNFSLTTGIRYDLQNGYGNLQPRINSNYSITKKLKLNMGFGISTKAPSMAYRYPGPTYFDIPLIDSYTGDVRKSLLLVYTYKYTPDNSNLKPSKSIQSELGLSYDERFFNASVYAYYKTNKDGFNAQTNYFKLSVPEYKAIPVAGGKPTYAPTGNYLQKAGLMSSVITNNVSSKTSGIEFFLNTKKVKAIQTSFSFNSSYTKSDFYNAGDFVRMANEVDILAGKKAWYGIYSALGYVNTSLTSRLSSDTHIPKLGFVLSLYYDFVWKKDVKVLGNTQYPIAYLDQDSNYYPITNFDPTNPDYGHLGRATDKSSQGKLPFQYGNLSLRLAKELKNKIRFSVNAYNVFNLKADYYDESTKQLYNYVQPLNIGAEVSLKF